MESIKKTVLIADDEIRMRRVIADYLSIKGYQTVEAANGTEAVMIAQSRPVDLILLDVMMPQMDGFEACRIIRRNHPSMPIIMLTAKSEEADELQGFSLGADEYIAKPFSLKILLARIEAVLRRGVVSAPATISPADGFVIDTAAREVTVNGAKIELTYTEFELLSFLVQNAGVALSRDAILDNVWKYDYYGDARTVDTHVKKLRAKLGASGERIKTIRGIGYKFEVKP